ncbi:PQQ-dependent sugar dehydrogenase [Oleiharenicola lentus]|uniref:PQQ-dependent sugar dehydrogenase n=1 Tax=Oleiharenicola lentus TaxID=2508720 RepID=UPI003F67662E
MTPRSSLFFLLAACTAAGVSGQVIKRDSGKLYAEMCAACHGAKLQGASAPSMLDDTWLYGNGDDESIAKSIRDGHPEKGMPPFGATLSASDVRGLVIFMREQRAGFGRPSRSGDAPTGVIKAKDHSFTVEIVADKLSHPWAVAFLPENKILVTEKPGRLRVIDNGKLLPEAIRGTPAVRDAGQGGLMEVALHPDYAKNGWIYLAYSDPAKDKNGRDVSLTVIVRGKIRDGAWVDQETIWKASIEFYRPGGGVHFGCRIAFDKDNYLFFSHGERGRGEDAQDLTKPNGKIHRIHDDGRIPVDNPFVDKPNAFKSIWTYGNRNPQGLDFDPRTGVLWETEHGPRGGDETNVIRRGLNYGWNTITYGMNYDGTPITDKTAQEGMEQPALYWTPSIAVCGIDFYEGDAFPKWKGHLLVTSLAKEELRLLTIDGEKVTGQQTLLANLGRLRDVGSGPDGSIYLVVNGPDRLVRLVPAK